MDAPASLKSRVDFHQILFAFFSEVSLRFLMIRIFIKLLSKLIIGFLRYDKLLHGRIYGKWILNRFMLQGNFIVFTRKYLFIDLKLMLDFFVSKAILVILSTDYFDVFIRSFLYCFRFTILDSLNVRLKLRHESIELL